ncbi:ADP-ribosyltransferase [Microtetraspora malaysiensis]|uniref:ADP-ribosyltransferase n=1 Tax=Microtetraspora malaysiensis TaxID=161358 RepID=UPI003D93B2D3
MGFDGFLVPDWAKPFVGYAVGMDWPEGDEDGCFRLADACATTAQEILDDGGIAVFTRLGDDWDGDALKEFVKRVQSEADPALAKLIEQLVSAALHYNDLGVQVQYTRRMIEVSVWFLIFQIMWLLAATAGPWGPAAAAMVGARVQLTRLAIAQLGKRLLINIGLFGGLMGGMDLAVQASQSRRDHLDWEQIMTSAGTGALLGTFLTGFTGIVPARSIWGLMGRSGLASGAADLTTQLSSGQPLDLDRLLKSFTSGVLGGADAHWASWSPFAQGKSSAGPAGEHGSFLASLDLDPNTSSLSSPSSSSHYSSSSQHSQAADGSGALPSGHFPENSASQFLGKAGGDGTTLAGAAAKQDVSFKSGLGIDALINGSRTADLPGSSHAGDGALAGPAHAGDGAMPGSSRVGDGPVPASAKPAGLGPASLAGQRNGPFRMLEYPGKSGDGYVNGGLWGKYGAAGVLIRGIDEQGQPRYLLMQQSQYVSNAGKWQLPGGALDSLESPVHGAARELSEELGVNQNYLNRLKLRGEHAVEVGDSGWRYTNLAAEGPMFSPKLDTFETSDAKWFTLKELSVMANNGELHPALAKALPDLLSHYHKDAGANPVTPRDHYTGSGATRRFKPPVDFGARTVPGDLPNPGQTSHGKPGTSPPAYSGLTPDGRSPALEQTIRRTESGLYYTAAAPHVPLDAPFGTRVVGPTFGNAVWTGVFNEMSPAERAAAERYASSGYKLMNGYLREGDAAFRDYSAYEITESRQRVIGQINALNAVLHRQPVPETIDVFRAVRLTPKLFSVPIEELPGTVQRDPGFFSTNLGDMTVMSRNVHLHLRVPEGTPAFFLKLISRYKREEELLLGTGVSWFAEDVRRQDGKWHVYGWVLPEGSGN